MRAAPCGSTTPATPSSEWLHEGEGEGVLLDWLDVPCLAASLCPTCECMPRAKGAGSGATARAGALGSAQGPL